MLCLRSELRLRLDPLFSMLWATQTSQTLQLGEVGCKAQLWLPSKS